jgi:hypothetical protein
MKNPIARLALIATLVASTLAATAAEPLKYRGKPGGNKMRIEGTSTIHDWWAESSLFTGRLDLPDSFPTDPSSKEIAPGKIDASATVTILVRTLKSSSGSAMDKIMQDTMKATEFPRIEFKLSELTFKEFKDAALAFDAQGELTVHGQTKKITMPVEITRTDSNSLKITGTTAVKMTDFGMEPPAPKIALGAIKTGDDVTLVFEWNVQKAG